MLHLNCQYKRDYGKFKIRIIQCAKDESLYFISSRIQTSTDCDTPEVNFLKLHQFSKIRFLDHITAVPLAGQTYIVVHFTLKE